MASDFPVNSAVGITGPIVPTQATIRFGTLSCIFQETVPVDPYIWPALIWIDKSALSTGVVAPPVSDARVLIKRDMQTGQIASIPISINDLAFVMQKDRSNYVVILVVVLWEQFEVSDTPWNAVQAGFEAYSGALQQAISDHLLQLKTSDPAIQQQVISAIKSSVSKAIRDAITNSLSRWQKLEVYFGSLVIDSVVGDSSAIFTGSSLKNTSFTISFGEELPNLYKLSGNLFLTPQIVSLP